ncbi:MAG: hypothetical protein ABI217_04605 [Chthoniobacterales bacterium]
MKTTTQILDHKQRHESDLRASRPGRNFPQIEQHYQTSKLPGSCGEPVKFQEPAFFKISNDYFADEAPRSFAVDAGVFAALILTALLPIVNSVQAVATLIHSVSVL